MKAVKVIVLLVVGFVAGAVVWWASHRGGPEQFQTGSSICTSQYHQTKVTVNVETSAPGVDKEIVGLCTGDMITWQAGPNVTSWSVTFATAAALGQTQFSNASATGTAQPQKATKPYKYTITVNGTPYDPGIIIMR